MLERTDTYFCTCDHGAQPVHHLHIVWSRLLVTEGIVFGTVMRMDVSEVCDN